MKNSKLTFRIIILLIFSISLFLQAQNNQELKSQLQKTINEIQKDVVFPGMTCAVTMPDNTIIKLATGYSDLDAKIKMKDTHRMFSGSTGKTFVAAVLLQFVEEGKLSLKDKVSKYLGDLDWFNRIPNSSDITIEMLAKHTSGLPRYVFDEKFSVDVLVDLDKVWIPKERLSYILDMEPIHPAGKGWSYSDTGYIILGMVIEKISEESFYSEATKRFLAPYKLKSIEPAISRKPANLAQGHSGENPFINAPKKVVNNGEYFINPQLEWCGGGFIGAAEDLSKWAKLYFSGSIFKKSSKIELYSAVDFETGQDSKNGYGVCTIISDTEIGRKIGHTGLMMGYITEMAYFQDYDFAVAIQINQDNFQGNEKNLGEYSLKIAKEVFKYLEIQ